MYSNNQPRLISVIYPLAGITQGVPGCAHNRAVAHKYRDYVTAVNIVNTVNIVLSRFLTQSSALMAQYPSEYRSKARSTRLHALWLTAGTPCEPLAGHRKSCLFFCSVLSPRTSVLFLTFTQFSVLEPQSYF